MSQYTVDVMIPTYNQGRSSQNFCPAFLKQTLPDPFDPGREYGEKVLESGVGAAFRQDYGGAYSAERVRPRRNQKGNGGELRCGPSAFYDPGCHAVR